MRINYTKLSVFVVDSVIYDSNIFITFINIVTDPN